MWVENDGLSHLSYTVSTDRSGRSVNNAEGRDAEDGRLLLTVPTLALDDMIGQGRLEHVDLIKVGMGRPFILFGKNTTRGAGTRLSSS
jgi:hypothetical protein